MHVWRLGVPATRDYGQPCFMVELMIKDLNLVKAAVRYIHFLENVSLFYSIVMNNTIITPHLQNNCFEKTYHIFVSWRKLPVFDFMVLLVS